MKQERAAQGPCDSGGGRMRMSQALRFQDKFPNIDAKMKRAFLVPSRLVFCLQGRRPGLGEAKGWGGGEPGRDSVRNTHRFLPRRVLSLSGSIYLPGWGLVRGEKALLLGPYVRWQGPLSCHLPAPLSPFTHLHPILPQPLEWKDLLLQCSPPATPRQAGGRWGPPQSMRL